VGERKQDNSGHKGDHRNFNSNLNNFHGLKKLFTFTRILSFLIGMVITPEQAQKYCDDALAIVTEAHLGQFRADKKTPYIAHPVEVARRAAEHITDSFSPFVSEDDVLLYVTITRIVGLAHDVREDNPEFPLETRLRVTIPDWIVGQVMRIIGRLSNTSGGDFLDYVLTLRDAPLGSIEQAIVLTVKEEDMNVNYDDSKNIPSEGRRRALQTFSVQPTPLTTKILLAHYILFGRKPYAAGPVRPEYA